jgi:alkenylglycerophosphocholine/alkenylglycerophosphoethanolamine hydrolase
MNLLLLGIALLVAFIDWFAVAKINKSLEYAAKPGVMIFILAWLVSNGGLRFPLLWFSLGILLSMAGDIFLMLRQEQFIAGLVSFLFAQIFYIIGLSYILPPFNIVSLVLAVFVFLTARQIYLRLSTAMKQSSREKLLMPVLVYTLVISVMLFSALVTLVRPEWKESPALLVSFGALFFFISDSLLAWNKFVHPLRNGKLLDMVTYHIGQIMLAIGAASHFLK